MLSDLFTNLRSAKTLQEQEKALKQLEKVGVDRYTANLIVKETKEEQNDK